MWICVFLCLCVYVSRVCVRHELLCEYVCVIVYVCIYAYARAYVRVCSCVRAAAFNYKFP